MRIPWMAGQIEWEPVEQIQQPSRATRRHSKKQSKLLIKGMKEFGFTTPLLLDNDYTLVAGVARLEAAKAIGMDVVPVIRILAQIRAIFVNV